ncbi:MULTISPECIES: LysR family transcriptional regulator [unclassified Leisingera]|uniref:LysR family transcriptional regulator n=1 Tax=unclassified Leisingera TaxID=2614906 RepID=UPI0002F8AF6D|nr:MULTISPECIES: LysR family transcriptional regulator [unclassified Leisingera]KIC17155.1 LysR family transcriptional regulator [Leisingera sp. ANG-DT]KIC25115.1 LysR family transcriptional regulator [Leisingera sp. ANG-M6]KIC26915.1 LysR family transcriptional regulator [Leisingera sp. ANG-S3]KIC31247.1 LysR family transcriptional regulator [Leisingera sp. ANG-S5]KIC50564.1 LysR family transcriptional regulator [Leisingera sp. ANG-S]
MNSHQLAVFREVMKTGSVSQAARNLHRTQPAVSAAIKTLEEELGLTLFLREGRRLVPVPEAHYLMVEASEILNRLETAQQNLVKMRERVRGAIRVVAMPGPSVILLPEFVSRFVADKPEVNVTLATRSSPQVRSLIAANSFDIGFCDMTRYQGDRKLYKTVELPCNCLCAVPAGHRLARKDSISVQDLSGEPMGALQPDHSTHQATAQAFVQADADFNLRYDAEYFLPLFHFVAAGQACAVVDVLSAESYRRSNAGDERIRFLPFEPAIPFGYSILTPSERPLSQLAASFTAAWQEHVAEILARTSG